MKKVIRFRLVLSVLLIMFTMLLPSSFMVRSEVEITRTAYGYMYSHNTFFKDITIFADRASGRAAISISYAHMPNRHYEWILNEYPSQQMGFDTSYWQGIINYAESSPQLAKVGYGRSSHVNQVYIDMIILTLIVIVFILFFLIPMQRVHRAHRTAKFQRFRPNVQ